MNWLSRPILRKRSVNEGTFREFRERGGGGWCTLARNIGNKKTFPPPEKWLLPPNIYFPSGSSTIGDKEVATPSPSPSTPVIYFTKCSRSFVTWLRVRLRWKFIVYVYRNSQDPVERRRETDGPRELFFRRTGKRRWKQLSTNNIIHDQSKMYRIWTFS